MAFSLGSIGGMLTSWLLNPLIWLTIIFIMVGFTWGLLAIRRKRKLIYPLLELVDHGNNKFSFNILKCGWFGKKKFLRGLWDSGEEQMESQDKDIIYEFSTEDFQEINGKRGVIAFRDPVNQNILVPITRTDVIAFENGKKIDGRKLLAEIAPANFRDVATEIIKDADRETSDWKEKLIQWIVLGGIIIFALVSIIVITQMVKNGQDKAAALIVQAGETCLKNAKEVCGQIASAVASGAP